MADINVNVRGRDDGAGKLIDNLREKVNNLNNETGKLNSNSVRQLTNEHYDLKKDTVREEFKSARQASYSDFLEDKKKYESGQIDSRQFSRSQKAYEENIKELDAEEKQEIKNLQIEQNNTLRELLDEIKSQNSEDIKSRQHDDSEFTSARERNIENRLSRQISRESEDNDKKKRDSSDDEKSYSKGQMAAGFRQSLLGVARGDLTSTVMGGTEMLGGAIGGKLGKAFTLTGFVALLAKELIGFSDKTKEALAPSAGMRGGFANADSFNKHLRESIMGNDFLDNIGLSDDEFANSVNSKLANSKISKNVAERAFEDEVYNKGFGADISGLSQFERFAKNQETSFQMGLDILNVLTSIDESSLKSNDLTTLSEKIAGQESIFSIQKSKRDIVDNDSALKIMAAFEKVGLSGKGERQADFLNQTINGLGEGGGDNAMLLKYEAAKRANPNIANDPAALKRFVRFNSDDPNYMNEFGKLIGQISGGNQIAMDDISYTIFNPQNESDMNSYDKWYMGKNGIGDILSGKQKLDKTRKQGLDKESAMEDATASVGVVTHAMSSFGNEVSESINELKEVLKNPLKVSVLNFKDFFGFGGNKTHKGK